MLKWFRVNPEFKKHPEDRSYQVLCYVDGDKQMELIHLNEIKDGGFWWFVYSNGVIYSKSNLGPCTLKQAEHEAYEYAKSELLRLAMLKIPIKEAPQRYKVVPKDKDIYLELKPQSKKQAFILGMDWCLKNIGLPQKPRWAKYVVQNRDGNITYFENIPKPDYNKGVWIADGRTSTVRLNDTWDNSLKRVY